MMKIPTNHLLVTHQREAMNLDKKGVRMGDQYHLMQPIFTYGFIGRTHWNG
jgi:hypothetical protein